MCIRGGRGRAFTLVELLVVVGIIAASVVQPVQQLIEWASGISTVPADFFLHSRCCDGQRRPGLGENK